MRGFDHVVSDGLLHTTITTLAHPFCAAALGGVFLTTSACGTHCRSLSTTAPCSSSNLHVRSALPHRVASFRHYRSLSHLPPWSSSNLTTSACAFCVAASSGVFLSLSLAFTSAPCSSSNLTTYSRFHQFCKGRRKVTAGSWHLFLTFVD